jgi:choloylglycine hydrolase
VADKAGDVATIEFLEGELVVHRGSDLPYTALANCTYETSMEYKLNRESSAGRQYNGWTNNSSGRFTEAATMVAEYDEDRYEMVDYAFSILDSVAQHPGTVWSIVYDISNAQIFFKTVTNSEIRDISLVDADLSCEALNLYADMDQFDGSFESMQQATVEANLDCINKVFDNVEFLRDNVSPEMRQGTAVYFRSVKCGSIKE